MEKATKEIEIKQAAYDVQKERYENYLKNTTVQNFLKAQEQLQQATIELYAAKINSAKTRVYSPSKKNTSNNSNK
ncbi:MAG: hypothetical protein IKH36_03780 [Bacilli bacterium]|nr:hypothetical protein [Bacilli bacterium]